jgi:hypothetical protein
MPKALQDLVQSGDVQGISNAIKVKNGQELEHKIAAASLIIDAGDNSLEALELGTIGTVLEAFQANKHDTGIREVCCMFIAALCIDDDSDDTIPEIADLDGIKVLIESLQNNHMRPMYKGFAWRALDIMRQDSDLVEIMANEGGMDLAMSALAFPKSDRTIIYPSFGVACAIITECEDHVPHTTKFVERNGFQSMIAAMDRDKKDEILPKSVGKLFKALLERRIFPADPKILAELLSKFVTAVRRIKGYGGPDCTKAEFMSVLYASGNEPEAREVMLEAGVIDLLLDEGLVREQLPFVVVMQSWCTCLLNFTTGGAESVRVLTEKGVVELLMTMLKIAKDNTDMTFVIVNILRVMALSDTNSDATDAAIPFVIDALEQHPCEDTLQLVGISFLVDLAKCRPQCAFVAVNAGAAEAALRVVKQGNRESDVHEKAVMLLCVLGNTDQILRAKIVPLLRHLEHVPALAIGISLHMFHFPDMTVSQFKHPDTGFQMQACTPSEWRERVEFFEELCEAVGLSFDEEMEGFSLMLKLAMAIKCSSVVGMSPNSAGKFLRDQLHAAHSSSSSSEPTQAYSAETNTASSDAGLKKLRDASAEAGLKKVRDASSDAGLNALVTQDSNMHVCAVCGKSASEAGLQVLLHCSACTIKPKYCSGACQKVAWKGHKAVCKANRRGDDVD